ncbi:MAG: 1-acyl-sn-glycerol-3-phosphate acyltransferase [Chitinivibrionales bacterium]|nr:1-acyl-sn-glycerol-3-phosphate acyltransferase [Chitinivibrionales bacterium]
MGKKTFFIISNHVSYLDILILSSHQPSAFITSVEIQKTFFMGFLATLGGSLFVERRNKAGLHREIAAMRQTCEHGVPIVLFPEGTSSNGETVLPFKSSLFQSAIEAGIDIIPVCLRYKTIDGRPVTKCNRDRLFYYGSIYFFPHLLQLPFVRCAEVNLTYLDPISVRDGMNRKELAALSFQRIYTAYHHSDQSDAVTVDANL